MTLSVGDPRWTWRPGNPASSPGEGGTSEVLLSPLASGGHWDLSGRAPRAQALPERTGALGHPRSHACAPREVKTDSWSRTHTTNPPKLQGRPPPCIALGASQPGTSLSGK